MTGLTEAKSDAELLSSFVIARSDEAFAAIVERHINLVYATAVRRVKDPHMAEDVTQAVFLVLSKKAANPAPSIILAGWLYQTTRFVSTDAIKMKKRREYHERQGAILRATPATDDAGEKISLHLDAAVDALGDRDRNLILLRFFEGQGD